VVAATEAAGAILVLAGTQAQVRGMLVQLLQSLQLQPRARVLLLHQQAKVLQKAAGSHFGAAVMAAPPKVVTKIKTKIANKWLQLNRFLLYSNHV